MPEATVICCDCSEWMRNGDFTPNRFGAQRDSIHEICNAKTQQNHENTVGLIAMGKDSKAEVLVNCTSDMGRLLGSVEKMKIGGKADILVAIQTAQLALKHRKNKKQTQRIILFVGSPIQCSLKLLTKAAKKLKKNNVAVDVINFGEEEQNEETLKSFMKAIGNNTNCRLVTVSGGTGQLLSDSLISSAILAPPSAQMNDLGLSGAGQEVGTAPVGGDAVGGGFAEYGGIDPNVDPEMAMAMRMSLEAAKQREAEETDAATSASGPSGGADAAAAPADAGGDAAPAENPDVKAVAQAMDIDDDDDELLRALQMSMMDEQPAGQSGEASGDGEPDDDEYMQELLGGLPGIDQDDVDDILNDDKDKDKDKDKDDKPKDGADKSDKDKKKDADGKK